MTEQKIDYIPEMEEPTTASRQAAFHILQDHSDCLKDDVSLNALIDAIAEEIDAARGDGEIGSGSEK